jgi:hypothetical protein
MRRQNKSTNHGKDMHFLNDEGMVACNPRDKEAAHRAQDDGIATDNIGSVTCRKCILILHKILRKE